VYLTGFTDEATSGIDGQIAVCRELGWTRIDLRTIGTDNVVTMPEADFARMLDALSESGIRVSSFGSRIANWSRTLNDPVENDLEELESAIPRMKRAGTRFIRIMSYRPPENVEPDDPDVRREVVRRLQLFSRRAEEAGITLLHENCETWGGQSLDHTRALLDAIPSPAFQLAYDTGNPPALADMRGRPPYRFQDALDFYEAVRERVAYIHIKDARDWPEPVYTWPGEGQARLPEILAALRRDGFDGPVSIEPHMAVVYHKPGITAGDRERKDNFIEYARRTAVLLAQTGITTGVVDAGEKP